jgi:hypothetical protein
MLDKHVMDVQDDALSPLLHFALDDFPISTKSPGRDDSNMCTLFRGYDKGNRTVSDGLMAKYLSGLKRVESLPKPTFPGANLLPVLDTSPVGKALGRSGS